MTLPGRKPTRGQIVKRAVLTAWVGGLFLVAGSCSSSAGVPEDRTTANSLTATSTAAAAATTCADVEQKKANPSDYMTWFATGPVRFAAEPPYRTSDNNGRLIYVFKMPIYMHDVTDRTVTVTSRSITAGGSLEFSDGGEPRRPGPLFLNLDEINKEFHPAAGWIPELGIYEITATGDGGRVLGTRRVAFCSSVVVLL
jgi:hypothetical protein